jgi:hypothetical protein
MSRRSSRTVRISVGQQRHMQLADKDSCTSVLIFSTIHAPIMDPEKLTATIVKDSADIAAECAEVLACCDIVQNVVTPTLDLRSVDELDVCLAAFQHLTFVQ